MKLIQGRVVEIAMAIYISIGILFIHKALDVYSLILSGSCGLLALAVMISDQKNGQRFGEYDSWGWSKGASRLVANIFVITGLGGITLWEKWIHEYLGKEELLPLLFLRTCLLFAMGVIMGIAIYLRSYLEPINNDTADVETLKLEHNEWSGLLQTIIMFGGILFIATGFLYMSGLFETALPTPIVELFFFLYLTVGYVIWIIRPIVGRCKEIRDHMNELQRQHNSSNGSGNKYKN